MPEQPPARSGLPRRAFLKTGLSCSLALPLVIEACGETRTEGDLADAVDALTDLPGPDDGVVNPDEWDKGIPIDRDPGAVDEAPLIFSLGVAAGDVHAQSVCFWSFAEDDTPKMLKVWRSSTDGTGLVLVKSEEVTPTEGYLKAILEGFAPATWYDYAFFSTDEASRSKRGRVRTAFPEGSQTPLVIAATTCTHHTHMPYQSLLTTAKYDFDVFCHLGDMSYNDGAVTKADFRAKWREAVGDPGYQAILAKAGFYITLDDHEVIDNSKFYGLAPVVMKAGLDAFRETLPIPLFPDGRLWSSYRWGSTAEIFLLDCRTERQPETRTTTTPIYISEAQMSWLKESLASSPCHFKVLMNSVPILGFTDIWPEKTDRWQAYQEQREELLDHIISNDIKNVLFLTGDYHLAYVARVETAGPYRDLWEVMVGLGAPRIPNPLVKAIEIEPDAAAAFLPEGQFDYLSDRHAATLLDLNPITNEVRIRYIDAETEETLYDKVLKPGQEPVGLEEGG